ncbi:MAG: TaqI-like C-terminal specificity domain-containing protein, partial [Rhodocyclaceae bacterium]
MPAPAVIRQLVERFEANLDAYRGGGYNETLLRRDFLDPFFKALGWDIDNSQDYAEAFREVIHEDAIKVGGSTKAPDYSFRIGGRRIFFLEAKKPSVYIKEEIAPAYQLRRYAWSANLPLSILSDFEEFAVYDCRAKPAPNDKPSKGRLLYLTYRDYLERWDEIAAVFSKEAVLKGSFDRYARAALGKRGTATVDAEFLAQIEQWRDLLAKNLALRNPGIGARELNFAVQATIDRIVFLRICEDRGIEPLNRLQGLANGPNIYPRLAQAFREADERYNSGLFHFRSEKDRPGSPDEFTLGLKVDDKLLKDLLNGLYYPESPYEFSVLPADILGQVYERFLGSVIRLTAGGQAKVEEKPEVKKAGGVYYTPTYIVDYIVRQTVGRLLESQSPKDAAKLKILDPACGSGSFLIGAYQHLLDWHLAWYAANDPEKHAKGKDAKLYRAKEGWRLTASERKRILVNNIYGVDIDAQAVEVTKLSLLLKVLEGETDESLNAQMKLFHERALPDLDGNIKCGNSLIGPDFFDGRLDLDEEERRRINAFDWPAEFPSVFPPSPARGRGAGGEGKGGFDAVIGNPPYVRQESLSEFKAYFQSHYESYDGVADLYAYFMEKGVALLREGGLFSIIVSSSFLRASYGRALRETLKQQAAVLRLVDFGGLAVFANAKDTYVCIPLLERGAKAGRIEVARIASLESLDVDDYVRAHRYTVPQARFNTEAWSLKSDEENAVFEKIVKAGVPLGKYVDGKFFRGLLTGLNEAFEISPEQRAALLKNYPACNKVIKSFLGGQDIRRYRIEDDARYLIVLPNGWTRQQSGLMNATEKQAWHWLANEYPALAEHLASFADALRKRQDQGEFWWELRPCDYYASLEAPKLVFPDICKAPRFTLDTTGFYLANTAYCLGTDDRYLLGILNSRLFWFAIGHISIPFGMRAGEYRYRLIYQYMKKVPIRVIDRKDKQDRAHHEKMVALVEQTLKLHRDLAAAKTAHDKTLAERQIAATDRQIDRLVYELYGLT